MSPSCPGRRPRPARGAGLVEQLVALLVFSVGVLGLVGLQAAATRAQTGGKLRGDAAALAGELSGQLWAVAAAQRASYNTAGGGCAATPGCAAWLAKVQAALPAASASVEVEREPDTQADQLRVELAWTPPGEGVHRHRQLTALRDN